MYERGLVLMLASALSVCLVAPALAANDHGRQRAAGKASIESATDKVSRFPPDTRIAVRNVKLASAPPVEEDPSAFVRFDVFNEGEQDASPVVVEIAILETPPQLGDVVPIPTTLVGPFRIRANTALKAGYSVHYELRLRNVSAFCDCTATVDVVQDESVRQPQHVFDVD